MLQDKCLVRSVFVTLSYLLVLAFGITNVALAAEDIISTDPEKSTGILVVSIKPGGAKTTGARWKVDGGAWQKSGHSLNLSTGSHLVSYKSIDDWTTPKQHHVTIKTGQLTSIKGSYIHILHDTIMLPGNVPLDMEWIPTATFLMGAYTDEADSDSNEFPQHQVSFSSDFFMGATEVTKAQWQAVMGTTPWEGQDVSLDPNSSAVFISWDLAKAFTTVLSALTGKTYSLPTEAQWEYACRAGTATRFYWGDDTDSLQAEDYEWFYNNADHAGQGYAHVVGLKLPNTFLLYDMCGNASEWCSDWYGLYSPGTVVDPTGPATGTFRVVRSGDWTNDASDTRSAHRRGYVPSTADYTTGFRIVRISN